MDQVLNPTSTLNLGATADGALDGVTPRSAVDLLLTRPVVAIAVLVVTWIFTRLARVVVRRVVRRLTDRSQLVLGGTGRTLWRSRVRRVFGETVELAETRRRQRIDAISRMVGHMLSLIAWLTALVIVLHVLHVDLVPVLTSAGFIGAGLAIGGQHAVRDFISGIGILVEDRFGAGDRIVGESATGKEFDGVVQHVGAFSTRLTVGASTLHVGNGSLGQIRNLSQTPVTTEIEVPMPADLLDRHTDDVDVDAESAANVVAFALRQAAGNRNLTGLVLVDDVKTAVRNGARGSTVAVEVRTAQPLTEEQADRLQGVAADALWQTPVWASGQS